MGLSIYNVYGLTESCSPATITPLEMEGPVDEQSGALSVGLVIPGHEAWIVDLDDPTIEVPPGEEGDGRRRFYRLTQRHKINAIEHLGKSMAKPAACLPAYHPH